MHVSLDHKFYIILLLFALILLVSPIPIQAHPAFSRTFSLDTSLYHFKLNEDNSRIKFSASTIYYDKFSWINNDTMKFYNLKITDADEIPNPLSIDLSGPANITISTLFVGDKVEATISASTGTTSTTKFIGNFGSPSRILINDEEIASGEVWSYDASTQTLTITWTHSSDMELVIQWIGEAEEAYSPTGATDPLIAYLIEGDILGFTIACYVSRIGMAFYGILLLIISGVFYNRTKSLPFISVMWLVLGGVFITLTWVFSPLAILLIVFGLVGIIYSLFEKESS